METLPCCNSVRGHQIATNFCTCHDSTAVVPCTKFCSDHCIRIEVRANRNFHRIWIAMEKPLVKRGPVCPIASISEVPHWRRNDSRERRDAPLVKTDRNISSWEEFWYACIINFYFIHNKHCWYRDGGDSKEDKSVDILSKLCPMICRLQH